MKSAMARIWFATASWISRQLTFTKLIVLWIIYKSVGWIDQSYALAWAGKTDIAEDLSTKVVIELLGVILLYCLKAIFENLSKYNDWPDKGQKSTGEDPEEGQGI
jgi:hypothetical protein